jgi:hypothetical protein
VSGSPTVTKKEAQEETEREGLRERQGQREIGVFNDADSLVGDGEASTRARQVFLFFL